VKMEGSKLLPLQAGLGRWRSFRGVG